MWLTNASIRRPVFITMVVLALIILGWVSRLQMPAERNPKIDFPYITVLTVYPGAGPQEIETLVSKPIEDAVGSTGGMRNVTSTSQDGASVVMMEFELGTNVDAAAADVRDKISAVRGSLPQDIEEPSIMKLDIGSMPIMTMALEGNLSGRDARILADRTVKDMFGKVEGAASVSVGGGQVREVRVAIDRDRLQAYGLSISDVAQAMRSENMNLPSGSIEEGSNGGSDRDYAVRTVGEFKSADEIENIRLKLPAGNGPSPGTVRLGDIATVKDTIAEPDVLARLNQKDSVALAIQKQSDANTVAVAKGVWEQIDLLNGDKVKSRLKLDADFPFLHKEEYRVHVGKGLLPAGERIVVATDESQFVEDALGDVNKSLIEGVLLVVLIVFVFLHSGRATAIVAAAIPTSLVATYLPMKFFGFSMNMMTLLALSLCVGILVDDSIVVLENIERHLRKGERPRDAALNGRAEIGLAAVAITFVDVVVFVPIAFMGGIVGQFFRQFGITVAIATLFSLFMSFTLTPMLASRWLRPKEEEEAVEARTRGSRTTRLFSGFERFFALLDHQYRGLLAWAVDNKWLTFAIGGTSLLTVIGMSSLVPKARPVLVLMVVLISVLAAIPSRAYKVALTFSAIAAFFMLFIHFPLEGDFFPNVDQGIFSVTVEMPAGTGLDATDKVVKQVEALLAKIPDMEYYQAAVGSSSAGNIMGAGDNGPQYARISVKLVDKSERKDQKSVDDVVADLNTQTALIPGGKIRVAVDTGMGPSGQPVQLEVTGPDMAQNVAVSKQVMDKLSRITGIIDIQSSWKVGKPELQVTVDRTRAAELGMSVAQIATVLRTSIEGDTNAKLRDGSDEYDIRVQMAKFDRQDVADVASVIVGHNQGAPVYLRDVAKVELAAAPTKIQRKNRQRLITVGANLARGYSQGTLMPEIQKSLATINTGSSAIGTGGSSKMMIESALYMFAALLLAIALVYMLMGALFESFITPLVIMFSLPQAMIGAMLALMLTGYTLSIISMIGIIMLVGLVTKNAILLIDYTNTLRSRGLKRRDALLEAGPTRLRPILMTTLAMIGGMSPTAFALSRGSEQRAPMAVAVIGGLILSTMLTLLVIPAVYTIVDDITTAGKRRFRFWHVAGQDQLSEVAEAEREERLSGSYREELEGELEPMDS